MGHPTRRRSRWNKQSERSRPAAGEGANAPAASPLAASTTARRLEANEVQRAGGTARKLSDEQEREVTRLYAATTTPVSEIARTFGIAESSVYRVSQRHGAALRGTQLAPGTPPTLPTAASVSGPSEGIVAASAAKAPEAPLTPVESAGAAGAARTRLRGTAAREAAPPAATPSTGPRVSAARARLRLRGTTLRRLWIRFLAERVVKARDIQDALRQAESIRALEVTAVMREE